MAHQVLARKWRPRRFEDVVGQDHVVKALSNALESGRIHHAYLFTGTRGVGKTTLARILAKALNCQGPDGTGGMTAHPCGVCDACREIDAGRFVDLLEVDAATNTKVDEMRELLETAQYMPVSGRYKVYIIDEVHMLSRSAFNAMLKTLEEPPGHVQFILATTDPQKLPVTVLSRCIQFNLKQLPPALIAGHLAKVLEAEGVPNEPAALLALGHAAQGSVRDSLSLLDQSIAYGAGRVTADGVASMLGALDEGAMLRVVDALARRDARGLINEVNTLAARSFSFETALRELAAVFQQLALVQAVPEAAGDLAEALKALATRFKSTELQVLYQVALTGRRDLYLAPDEQAGFTMSLLRMLTLLGDGAGGSAKQGIESASGSAASIPTAPATSSASRESAMPIGRPAGPGATVDPAANLPPAARPAMSGGRPAMGPPKNTSAVADQPSSLQSQQGTSVVEFDGDWPALVRRLNLPSMAGMLARQCEMQAFTNGVLELLLSDEHKHLADKAYQDKLRDALAPHLGANIRLNVTLGSTSGQSVAAEDTREMNALQQRAETAIMQDDFVNTLVREMGADVNPATIRPIS
jgi:DNA polymerase III subunit gamma/tau